MRVLVVEDDRTIVELVADGLKKEGFSVDVARTGLEGFHLASIGAYDVAVVDIMLPRLSGLELVEELRRQNNLTPVLMLSARNSVDDRVKGLAAGGDDYLTKPFAFAELVARIQALARRANAVSAPMILTAGDLTMDLARRRVIRGGREIDLQPREFALLECLVRNKGRLVSRPMIMDMVWGYDFDPRTNVVESRISRLREKVDEGFPVKLIRTVRGAGYLLEE